MTWRKQSLDSISPIPTDKWIGNGSREHLGPEGSIRGVLVTSCLERKVKAEGSIPVLVTSKGRLCEVKRIKRDEPMTDMAIRFPLDYHSLGPLPWTFSGSPNYS